MDPIAADVFLGVTALGFMLVLATIYAFLEPWHLQHCLVVAMVTVAEPVASRFMSVLQGTYLPSSHTELLRC